MNFERENIGRMQGYLSGEQPQDSDTIKLNTNENPYPPSPRVEAALRAISSDSLRRYPPPTADDFRDLAAARHGVLRDNIIATRGGDELLRLVLTTFVDPGETIVVTDPTYSLYPVLAQIQDCRIVSVPLLDDWSLPDDFADVANRVGAKLVLVVNPHAPTGSLTGAPALRQIAGRIDGLLLLDEAYADFVDPQLRYDSMEVLRHCDNVISLRTLSKGFSLAGLRFGYGIGASALIQPMLTKTRDSYNLDYISQQLARAALTDMAYAGETWRKVRASRETLGKSLSDIGLEVHPSQTNFLLARVPTGFPDARSLYAGLKERGVLVRYFPEPRLADKLRITVGTDQENERLLAALRLITDR